MSKVTFPEIASWPPANYNNPESLKPVLVGIEGPLTGLAILFVGARFYARTFVRRVLGWDDFIMLAALILVATITTLQCVSTLYNTGLHLWDAKGQWIVPTGKMTYATLILFAPASALTKISICMSYLRVFPSVADRRFAQFGIAFSITYCMTITLLNVFQCWPIASYWSPWKYKAHHCISREALTITTQALNSLSDLLIFLWPVHTLWQIRLPKLQRFGLIFVFSIGVVVCIAGVLRIWYLVVYFRSYDIYWNGTVLCILAAIETNLGIICGSLPGCKPLLGLIFPRMFGSSVAYSELSRPRQVLPGARISLRLSDMEKAYLPPASRNTSVASEMTQFSVPVKLDTRPMEYNAGKVAIMTPVIEVNSPTISERYSTRGAFSFYNDNEHDSS